MQKKLQVLIIEDEILIGMMLEESLQSLDYEVCAIVNTEAGAILQAEKYQPDLMIVDAGLRVGSGISAVEAIEKKRSIPHIFVTGDIRKVRSLHPDAIILQKPYFLPQLIAAIAQALDGPTGP